jgi:hypothetical protein
MRFRDIRLGSLRIVVAVVAAACVVASVSILGGAAASPAEPGASQHAGVARSLLRDFKVFRHRTGPRDDARTATADVTTASLPASVANTIAEDGDGNQFGIDQSRADDVEVSASANVWVVPGSRGVCLASSAPPPHQVSYLVTCGPLASAERGSLFSTDGPVEGTPASVTVVGLAPDANTSSVSVVASDGSTQQVPVVDNVYVWTGTGTPNAIQLLGASGHSASFPG